MLGQDIFLVTADKALYADREAECAYPITFAESRAIVTEYALDCYMIVQENVHTDTTTKGSTSNGVKVACFGTVPGKITLGKYACFSFAHEIVANKWSDTDIRGASATTVRAEAAEADCASNSQLIHDKESGHWLDVNQGTTIAG